MANRYIFFATAWSAINGGVNSFNFDLCSAIAAVGQSIDVFLEAGSPEDQVVPANIKVHKLPTKFVNFDQRSIKFIAEVIYNPESCIWVGHDAISGGAAMYAKNSLGGRSAVFHHMDYSNYYFLKQADVNLKIRTQKDLIKNADIVFAIGTRLFQNARHLRASHLETYELIPGVPEFSGRVQSHIFDHRVAICGRLDPSEDRVKNLNVAVKAACSSLSKLDTGRGSITLIGSPPTDLNIRKIEQNPAVAINSVPFINSRSDYFKELLDSDIVLMPSVKEGFGLVAWEAACLGIPVLVSQSSGFYEFLKEKDLNDLVVPVDISGIPTFDESKISEKLSTYFLANEAIKAKALKLAALLARYTWKSTAERFMSLLEGAVERSLYEPLSLPPTPLETPDRSSKERTLFLDKHVLSAGFERFEDLLALTARRRKILIEKSECKDSSRGQKIKFEYWATYSPQPSYFLYIHHSSGIKETVKRFARLLKSHKLEVPRNLFVLRRDPSSPQYIQKAFAEEGIASFIHDYTLKGYLWEFGIDEAFKVPQGAEKPLHYVDQAITTKHLENTPTARELILEKLRGKPEFNAHLVRAAGGMGKTWLCRSVASEITADSSRNNLVVLIQAENLRSYIEEMGANHVPVASVFDLYQLHAHSQKVDRLYDRETFELAVIAGNIILIIDGLDELATVLQERFDLSKFLESIITLSSSLSTSQILITTRDSLLIDSDTSIELGIAHYELLGFNSEDWTSYAKRRFATHPNSEEIVKRLNSTLSSARLKDEGGRVVPFFVDVLCTMFEDEVQGSSKDSFQFTEEITPYASNNEIIDHVVHSVFRREIRRQTIDLDPIQLMSVVSELVSEQGDSFSFEELKDLLALYFETRAEALAQKISLNPFFQVAKSQIRLRYDFLQSYFRALFLIDNLKESLHSPEALNAYNKSNATDSPEVFYLRKYYQGRLDILDSQVHQLLPKIRAYVKEAKDLKRIELGRRAISGVLKIYLEARGFNTAKMSDKIVELLPGQLSSKSIDGLCIYGDFPPLDFSEKTIFNSKFLDYKNFSKSKFNNAKFISCIFENCSDEGNNNSTISQADFDLSCTLGDVSSLVSASKTKSSFEESFVEAECLAFLRAFFKSGVSYDPKKSWLFFSNKVRGLQAKSFEKLIPEFMIVKNEKSDETYYTLVPEFSASARKFIDNNYIDLLMRKFISKVK